MLRKSSKKLIVALDIGTSQVTVLVAVVHGGEQLEIIGVGVSPARGLKRGVVVNIEATVRAIEQAISEAEQMAGCHIHSAYTGVSGSHIHGFNTHGMVAIRDKEVSEVDVARVLDAARAIAVPADQKILHVLPQAYSIDHEVGIREPCGMSGVRLEAKVHIVTGALGAIQNVVKCVQLCGLSLADLMLQQLAASDAVLREDEKELGVCVIDMGEGTTDVAAFTNGAVCYTGVIPVAGGHVSNDIAVALRVPTKQAEQIKKQHASVLPDLCDKEATFSLEKAGGDAATFSHKWLREVVSARYEELFEIVAAKLREQGIDKAMSSGIVLTGGASQVKGLATLAESVFQVPVRLGLPSASGVAGLESVLKSPVHAAAVGLLLYGLQQEKAGAQKTAKGVCGVLGRVKRWVRGNF